MKDTAERVTKIVSAFVKRNTISPAELPALISDVSQALSGLGQRFPAAPAIAPSPAVPIRRSVLPDKITCLECGYVGSMLKRHLTTAHNTTPDDYRARWGLKSDYPMVSSNYAARRSDLAKAAGLGTHGTRSPGRPRKG
jgi:predicted transcriptional regulator